MSIELRIADEDMMDLSVPDDLDPELTDAPAVEESALKALDPLSTGEKALVTDDGDHELQVRVKEIRQLYGIPEDLEPSKKWHKDIRLNVVHAHGVQDMSSDDVLAYFKAFDPASLEWVNDKSCNVLFDDAMTAARAMARLVTHRIGTTDATNLSALPPIEASSLKGDIPEGTWLLGSKHEKAEQLLIRFAKPDDKKKTGAGKYSEYYRKYGNPHYGGKKQLMSGSLAEKLKNMSEMEGGLDDDDLEEEQTVSARRRREPSPDVSHKPLGLRMKMRADDEEEENGRPRSFDKFSSESDKKSVWDRLEKRSVLDRVGDSSRVIQRKRGKESDSSGGSLSVWSRLSLPSKSSPEQKSGKKRNIVYSNIRPKK